MKQNSFVPKFILLYINLVFVLKLSVGEQIAFKIMTVEGLATLKNLKALNTSGRMHIADIDAFVCPETNYMMIEKATELHWTHGRKYLHVRATCNGIHRTPQILEMWDATTQAAYAIFEPSATNIAQGLLHNVFFLINEIFFVMSHMPRVRNRVGSICFREGSPDIRLLPMPQSDSWCMFSPAYWRELRDYEQMLWNSRAYENSFQFVLESYQQFQQKDAEQSEKMKFIEIYGSEDMISRNALVQFLHENI